MLYDSLFKYFREIEATLISLKHNFLFIHIPKTGGNSIQIALSPFSDDRIVQTQQHHDGKNRFELENKKLGTHKHSTLSYYADSLTHSAFQKLTIISCTRNPWDRYLSYYFSPHRGEVTWCPEQFKSFISDIATSETYLRLPDTDPFENVDFFIRFDHLNEDFVSACDLLKINPAPLNKVNTGSPRSHYREYYDSSSKEYVAKICEREIRYFGYTF